MSRAKYKGIISYKLDIENKKIIMREHIFIVTGHTLPFEFRPVKKRKG